MGNGDMWASLIFRLQPLQSVTRSKFVADANSVVFSKRSIWFDDIKSELRNFEREQNFNLRRDNESVVEFGKVLKELITKIKLSVAVN